MLPIQAQTFAEAHAALRFYMHKHGQDVATETWQGRDVRNRPDAVTRELLNVSVALPLAGDTSLDRWRQEIKPNLPWADEHFLERVSGEPLNPPPSWERWPWAKSASTFRAGEKFNHTYPERYWCSGHHGIRGEYGDLSDVVDLLVAQPHTRQAYLPIFFPEDTGVGDGGRKPCTLGYQFILRENELHVVYPMRSCDLVRHFADDVYLTVRLLLWVLQQCRDRGGAEWQRALPGTLTMHITSLHVFANDVRSL